MATTVLQVRMDEDLRNEASELFEKLGLDIPTAIRIFFKRAVSEKASRSKFANRLRFIMQV